MEHERGREDSARVAPTPGSTPSADSISSGGPPPTEPYPGASRPTTIGEWLGRLWPRLKHLVIHNILHLDDTPQRIALGVFLGFLIGATPTLGLQMITYFGLVAVLPVNKFSGLVPIWITNPLTAVPIYYANWRLGIFLMTGRMETSPESRQAIARLVEGAPGSDQTFFERMFSGAFWEAAIDALMSIGTELWVGSLVVGLVTGVFGYWATYHGVVAYRRRTRAGRVSSPR